ncbi:GNAT family N-acetyltransferase [Idiomarina loihiensis]|uniref:GNAT family N-acetyltransferase n=1 Tax=Idiomarina loihiensis TaxID=135577 RepID=UPI00384D143C
MSECGGYRQLQLLQGAGLWYECCEARSDSSIYLSNLQTHADAALSRYRDYLGHEFEQVWIDCSDGLHADAIAALCGTVTAGGLLSILLPAESNAMSHRMERFAAKRFAESGTKTQLLVSKPETRSVNEEFRLTNEQSSIFNALTQSTGKPHGTHIITAERGRGKSTLLGQALASVEDQSSIIVTAPRKANAKILLQQAPEAHFVAWDKLLEQPGNSEVTLIIDEAAGLPLWATEQLCQKFTPWLLATTVAGYEGCGRGFAVHFTDWAKKTLPQVSVHQLTQPLRWPANDPLEQWLTDTFLLNEQPVTQFGSRESGTFIKHASELEEGMLQQCFHLLLNAHYQSSPNDLNLLLAEAGHKLAYQSLNGEVIAVAWLMNEGPIQSPLKEEIRQGQRRPKGNLLPQAIGYFLQQDWAMSIRWLRVARIAVPAAKRRRKAASELLAEIYRWALDNNYQMLGTSFAWSPELDNFWRKNGYSLWRLSSRIDSVSARPAAIYAQPLSSESTGLYQVCQLLNQWGHNQLRWFSGGKEMLRLTGEHSEVRAGLIQAYRDKTIPFDAAHFALAQWFYWQHSHHPLTELLCHSSTTLKHLGEYWGGVSQRQANENLCKEVRSLH